MTDEDRREEVRPHSGEGVWNQFLARLRRISKGEEGRVGEIRIGQYAARDLLDRLEGESLFEGYIKPDSIPDGDFYLRAIHGERQHPNNIHVTVRRTEEPDHRLSELLDRLEEDAEARLSGYLRERIAFGRGMKQVIAEVQAVLDGEDG